MAVPDKCVRPTKRPADLSVGEEFETLDREVLVVSADIPPQDREADEQRMERENANADRVAHQQQELAIAAPAAGQHTGNAGQGDDNIEMQAPAARKSSTTPARQ
jgi:hypothetical protein